MIEITEDVEIKEIVTQKKIISEGRGKKKVEREVEYLIFKLKGEMIGLTIKDESDQHVMRKLRENGLQIEAKITLKISNTQKSILDDYEDEEDD